MKKGIYVPLSCAILTVAALSGCSTTNKIPDATIENAIQDSTNIYSDYGLSIQQLSFDSRNYDKQEKDRGRDSHSKRRQRRYILYRHL